MRAIHANWPNGIGIVSRSEYRVVERPRLVMNSSAADGPEPCEFRSSAAYLAAPAVNDAKSADAMPVRARPASIFKLLGLTLRNMLDKTTCAALDWASAANQIALLFGERFMQTRE